MVLFKIAMGRSRVVSEFFEIVYGPLGFVANRHGIFEDRFGSLWIVLGLLRLAMDSFWDVMGSLTIVTGSLKIVMGSSQNCLTLLMGH